MIKRAFLLTTFLLAVGVFYACDWMQILILVILKFLHDFVVRLGIEVRLYN